jgi:hypothetical protein
MAVNASSALATRAKRLIASSIQLRQERNNYSGNATAELSIEGCRDRRDSLW